MKPTIEVTTADGTRELSTEAILLKERNIFLFGEINSETLYSFTTQFLTLKTLKNTNNSNDTINIYLNSNGGEILSGLAIYDLIKRNNDSVNIYCIGIAASMGAIILSAGKKGNRFIYPHSKVMIHEPLLGSGLSNKSASSIEATAKSILETKDLLIDILTENTGNPRDVIEKAISYDNYMDAEEAIKFNIVDQIVD